MMKSRGVSQRAALQKKTAKRSQVLLPKEAEYSWEDQRREAYWKRGRRRVIGWHGAQERREEERQAAGLLWRCSTLREQGP